MASHWQANPCTLLLRLALPTARLTTAGICAFCSNALLRLELCPCAGAWVHLPYWSAEAQGCRDAEQSERCSSCAVEVIAPWRSLACLTPDATQLAAGPDWGPKPFK